MYKIEEVLYNLIDKERSVYELSNLYEQNRKEVSGYINNLICIKCGSEDLTNDANSVSCKKCNSNFPINNSVVDFRLNQAEKDKNWEQKNKQFLNYHKSLSPYTLLNSAPINSYVAEKTGLANIKNKTIVDVGAGTGHVFASFFNNPETLDYYLLDPNLRLLHDQFVRIYPKLLKYPLSHILSYAEKLPFKSNFADLVISVAAIDHLKDYVAFISESNRILKQGGMLLITSHLDKKSTTVNDTRKLSHYSFFEKLSRYLYYRKYSVGTDDHTLHLSNSNPIEEAMKQNNFRIIKKEEFKRYFYIVGEKK